MKRAAFLTAALLAGAAAVPVHARTEVHPYLEVQQVFDADLSGGNGNGGSNAYTGVGAGIDILFDQSRLHGQIDYRYDHFFSWKQRYRDGDIHSGLANVNYALTPEISLNAAGVATRTRGSLGYATPGAFNGNFSNTQQVYAAQAGPSYAGIVGPLSVTADYRFGWTKVDNGYGDLDLGPGQPVLDDAFTSTSHAIDASVGQPTGSSGLPFGWTASGGYVRDDIHVLGARYEGYFGRVDATVPLSPTLAALGGLGWERNRISQDQILTDAAGNAVLTDKRHLRSDHAKPRILDYDQDGLIRDVGVLWRPSPRLSVEVHGGRRYGETAVTGQASWQLDRQNTLSVVAYNDVQSFGRQLAGSAAALPTSFASPNSGIPIAVGGCVFGANGGQGGCLTGLSSVNSNFYRSRGVAAVWSAVRGRWTYGLGASYDHRRYLAGNYGATDVVSFDGVHDDVVTVNGIASRALTANSAISGTVYVAWYDTDLLNSPSYTTYGATGAYTRQFGRRLTGQAAVSIYSGSYGNSFGDDDQDVYGSALLALRYSL